MNITNRIIEICKNKKIKNIDLVNLGCGSQQTVSFVMNGKQKPNLQFLEILLSVYPDIDARWLMTGEANLMVEESRTRYGFCKECLKKDGEIARLEKECAKKDKRIEELLIALHSTDCEDQFPGKKAQ